MADLSTDQLKTLEQMRLRLLQLSQSIASLIDSIERNDPLPEWSSLQSRAAIISNNLSALSHHLSDNSSLLSSLLAYPTPDYPGRTESAILAQLMRTKLEPYAEDWIEQGRKLGREDGGNASADHRITPWKQDAKPSTALSGDDLKALWHWAPIEANRLARQRNWGGHYTLEEKAIGIENVVTGLRNKVDDDEVSEDESSSEDEEEERGDPMLPMEEIFKFMMTGVPPKSRVTPASRV